MIRYANWPSLYEESRRNETYADILADILAGIHIVLCCTKPLNSGGFVTKIGGHFGGHRKVDCNPRFFLLTLRLNQSMIWMVRSEMSQTVQGPV